MKVKTNGYKFTCPKCGHVEELSSYPIAQMASGYSVVFTCECGQKINLHASMFSVFSEKKGGKK